MVERKPEKSPSSVDLAVRILKNSKRPMRPQEIIEIATRSHGLEMRGKTPDATLNSNIINEIKRRLASGRAQRFVRVKPGHWGLVEYVGRHYEPDV